MSKRKKRKINKGTKSTSPGPEFGRSFVLAKVNKKGIREYYVYQELIYTNGPHKSKSLRVVNNTAQTFFQGFTNFLNYEAWRDSNRNRA